MKRILFTLILFPCFVFAQLELQSTPFIDGGIIFKNGDSLIGMIRMASSPFDMRFKKNKEQRKEEKIKFKKIEKIYTFTDSLRTRNFYYKNTNEDQFLHFVELLTKDTINIYRATSDNILLFYKNSLIEGKPNENPSAPISFSPYTPRILLGMRKPLETKLYPDFYFYEPTKIPYYTFLDMYDPFFRTYNREDHIEMEKKLNTNIGLPRIDYYVKKTDEDKLLFIGSIDNPFNKNFKKSATKYFEDCPILVARINEKEFRVKYIPEMIEFYKENCK